MIRRFLIVGALAAATWTAFAPAVQADSPAKTWDGLVQVNSKTLKEVYLLPGADFRAYSKVMLDPAEVDFVKGWVRHMNNTYNFALGQTSDADALEIAKAVRKGFDQIWGKAFTAAGWQVVTAPGPDVLRVIAAVSNLSITAPYTVTQGRTTIRTVDAGQAALLLEVRDSESGQVLGRAIDASLVGVNDQSMPRNQTSNEYDFGQLFDRWSNAAAGGLDKLKQLSPVDTNAQSIRK